MRAAHILALAAALTSSESFRTQPAQRKYATEIASDLYVAKTALVAPT